MKIIEEETSILSTDDVAKADAVLAGVAGSLTFSKLLGHSSVAVTARYLDHLSNAEAVEALSQADLPALGA